jgi:glycosyltransferase involved in cell wall biosynthesis
MQTLALVSVLKSLDFAIDLICYFEYEAAVVEEFQKKGARVTLLKMKRSSNSLAFIKRLRQIILMSNPDFVHVQYMAPGALPIIAARLAGVKKVFATVHQPYTTCHGRFARLILRSASLLTTRFIAVSQNAEKSWFKTSNLFDDDKPLKVQSKHFTIYNSVDTQRIQKIVNSTISADLRKELNITQDILLVGTVSRLRHEKGIDLLIESFSLIIKEGFKAQLLIVGSGQDEAMLRDLALKFGISNDVTFTGAAYWAKAMKYISIMDIVVVPSLFEGFGLTAAEAMAAGKPVVASDTSGLKEVVVDNETGILFPVNDPQALKTSLEKLIRDPGLRERMGNRGRKRAIANFGLEFYKKKINTLYNDCHDRYSVN